MQSTIIQYNNFICHGFFKYDICHFSTFLLVFICHGSPKDDICHFQHFYYYVYDKW